MPPAGRGQVGFEPREWVSSAPGVNAGLPTWSLMLPHLFSSGNPCTKLGKMPGVDELMLYTCNLCQKNMPAASFLFMLPHFSASLTCDSGCLWYVAHSCAHAIFFLYFKYESAVPLIPLIFRT